MWIEEIEEWGGGESVDREKEWIMKGRNGDRKVGNERSRSEGEEKIEKNIKWRIEVTNEMNP